MSMLNRLPLMALLAALCSCDEKTNGSVATALNAGTLTWHLLLAGTLAGFANYFLTYLELPAEPPKKDDLAGGAAEAQAAAWPKTQTEFMAILGYLVVGICGALLTPVVDAVVTLKGLEYNTAQPLPPLYYLRALGYGIVFGYSASRLFPSLFAVVKTRLPNSSPSPNPNPNTSPNPNPNPSATSPVEVILKSLPAATNLGLVQELARQLKLPLKAADAPGLVAEVQAASNWHQLPDAANIHNALAQSDLVLAIGGAPDAPRLAVVTSWQDGEPVGYWGGATPPAKASARRLDAAFAAGPFAFYAASLPNT